MRVLCKGLLLLCLPLLAKAQEAAPSTEKYLNSVDKQYRDFCEGKASEFANKEFTTAKFNTQILNEKNSSLLRNSSNFTFPNQSFDKKYSTDSFKGFSANSSYSVPDNKNLSTDKSFNVGGHPFDNKIVEMGKDRDTGKMAQGDLSNKTYAQADKMYQGKELRELPDNYNVINPTLKNKDDLHQDTLSIGDIKKILNKNN
jgi:hypothetical protein